jgi:hypothetical protein
MRDVHYISYPSLFLSLSPSLYLSIDPRCLSSNLSYLLSVQLSVVTGLLLIFAFAVSFAALFVEQEVVSVTTDTGAIYSLDLRGKKEFVSRLQVSFAVCCTVPPSIFS